MWIIGSGPGPSAASSAAEQQSGFRLQVQMSSCNDAGIFPQSTSAKQHSGFILASWWFVVQLLLMSRIHIRYKYLHPVFEECIWSQLKCPSQVVPRCRCLSSFDANKIAINFFPSCLLVGRQMSPGRSEARRGVHSRWPSSAAAGTNKSPHDQTCRRCLMMFRMENNSWRRCQIAPWNEPIHKRCHTWITN